MKIFISYAHVDEYQVRKLVEILRVSEHDPWFDQGLTVGRAWEAQLLEQIRLCDRFLYALTPESVKSEWCQWEFAQAVHAGKPVLPVLIQARTPVDSIFDGVLSRMQYADFSHGPEGFAVAKLLGGVNTAETLNPMDVPLIPAPHTKPERPIEGNNSDRSQSLADRLLQDAYAAFRAKNFDEAYELLIHCLRFDPEYGDARKLLAIVRRHKTLDILPPPFEWIDIPAGRVELDDGYGSFEVAGFTIAKYPVTNAQYQVFLDANDGYGNSQWWTYSEPAREWRAGHNRPRNNEFYGDDLPRTNVSWYESVAFCHWLSARIGDAITLPTEQQWQLAAQGNDGRVYPWGNEVPSGRLCNFKNNVRKTTPVTQFLEGASPYGVMDMVGNVWEWCLNDYKTPQHVSLSGNVLRVVRGGAWNYDQSYMKTSYRNYNHPHNWFVSCGFRIVFGTFM